jgi:hypothetical protein
MPEYKTVIGSLQNWEKGGVYTVAANPKHYVFSNIYEVASKSKPYEKVAVAINIKYVIEAVRTEGVSPWFACSHDESALIMDGEVEIHYVKPNKELVPESKEGAIQLSGEPEGKKMGWVKCGLGHMALLPKGSAYQFRAEKPGVMLVQTIKGDTTVEKWAEICQTK